MAHVRRPEVWLALALLASTPAQAQKPIPRSELPGIGSLDQRQTVDVRQMPWAALGRVQSELGTRCTGTRIAPRQVLTAAHCLVAPRSSKMMLPGSMHFLQGYANGGAAVHARVASYLVGEGFVPGGGGPAASDWAIMTLETAPPGPVLAVLRTAVPPRTALMLGGYQQDRPEVILADLGCRAIGELRGMLLHDCASTRGSSGGPLLARVPGGWAVAGVASVVRREVAMGEAVAVMGLPIR